MPLRSRIEPRAEGRSTKYLPYLTWLLLATLFAYLVTWYVFYRPSAESERQMAAIQSAMRYIDQNYVYQVEPGQLYRGAMRGIIRSLNDKYSYYLDPQEWKGLNEKTEGEYVGIGVRISQRDDWAVIVEVFDGGPAAKGGLKVGDIITDVGGIDAHGMSVDELVRRIQGRPDTDVDLKVRRPPQDAVIPLKLTRANIEVPSVRWRMLGDGVGLLSIETFDKNVSREVKAALLRLKDSGLRGLLLDLRQNAGGLMDQSSEVCDMFLDDGLILRLAGREGASIPPPEYAHSGTVIAPSIPIVVLVDGGTASAAEILSGALQANHRAVVVGTGTFGKGSVTNLLPLPDGSGIVLTVYHYVLAGGEIIEGHGVKPDIVVGELPPYPVNDEAKAEAWRQAAKKAAMDQQDRALQYLKQEMQHTAPPPEGQHAADAN